MFARLTQVSAFSRLPVVIAMTVALLLTLLGSPSTSEAATQSSAAGPATVASLGEAAAINVAAVPVAMASSKRVCSTGGYWYETDTLYRTTTYMGNGRYKHVVSWGGNRTVAVKFNFWHYYVHKAALIRVGSTYRYFPGSYVTVTNGTKNPVTALLVGVSEGGRTKSMSCSGR